MRKIASILSRQSSRLIAQALQVSRSDDECASLLEVRDHHDKPYMREKTAALLKGAGPPDEPGPSARQVALNGLLHERCPQTVRDWVHRYKEAGIDGFLVEEGRGQKPAFPPLSEKQMRETMSELVRRSPRTLSYQQSRWTLGLLRDRLGLGKAPATASGLSRMLKRLGITKTRGQGYTLSPDEHFTAKRAFIGAVQSRVPTSESPLVGEPPPSDRLFYLDELTYELHPPTRVRKWSPSGKQPTAERERAEPRTTARRHRRSKRTPFLPAEANHRV